MPIYAYWCQACGLDLEKLVTYNARDLPSCPDCGVRLTRRVSSFSFKMYNRFTKDGEGFSSVTYPVKEADIRNKYSVPKGVSV